MAIAAADIRKSTWLSTMTRHCNVLSRSIIMTSNGNMWLLIADRYPSLRARTMTDPWQNRQRPFENRHRQPDLFQPPRTTAVNNP